MNQNKHNPGDIHLEDDHGMVWLMRSNTVGCDKIFCDRDALAHATLTPSALVYYNGKPIGNLLSKQYNRLDGFLVAFFKLNISRDSLPDSECLYVLPKYDSDGIQCIRCQRIFSIGSEACECIEAAPAIQIPKIKITGVSIHNGLNEDIYKLDSRYNLLKQYFGGVIATIRVDNEEF